MSGHLIQIKGMHRLSIFFHHIVCNIHQVVDRPDTTCSQSSLHPFRRRSDLDIFADSCTVSGTQIAVFYLYGYIIINILIICLYLDNGRYKRLTESSRCLTGNSQNTVAVHTIRSNLIFKYGIPQAQHFHRIGSDRCIGRQNINTVLRCIRIHLTGGAQFFNRAHHTVGRHTS